MSTARRRLATVLTAAVVAGCSLLGQGTALALISDVDGGFGTGGSTTVPIGGSSSVGGIVERDDGTYVIGASVDANFTTVALTRSGDLLDTYGSGGIASTPIPGASNATVTDIALQDNGRVVLAGWENRAKGPDRFIVVRFRPGGAPDPSFSGDGIVTATFPQGDAYAYGVTVQPDGRIVAVGEVDPTSSSVSNTAVLRLDADGSPDGGFGDHGRRMIRLDDGVQGYDSPWRVVTQANGKLAMAGWAERNGGNYKTLVMRLRADGSLDTSFSGDGVVIADTDGVDNWSYAMTKDGAKLVIGVHTSVGDAGFLRLNGDGSRDDTFGGDGVVQHSLSTAWEVHALDVRADGRIVAVNGDSSGPNIVVLKPRGGLDTGYSLDGEGVGPYKGAIGEGLAVLGNGKVVVAGTAGSDVAATRFLAP